MYNNDQAILAYIENCPDPPTYRELQTHFEIRGRKEIVAVVTRLREKGLVLPSDGKKGVKYRNFLSRGELEDRIKYLEFELTKFQEQGFKSDIIEAIKEEKLPRPCRTVEDSVWNQCIDYVIAAHLTPYNNAIQSDQ